MEFIWFDNKMPWQAANIRTRVFIVEQGFVDEFDEIDDFAYHVVGFEDGKHILTGRLFKDSEGFAHIGRIAVEKPYRGKNLGKVLLLEIERKAKEVGFKTAVLGAQLRAKDFYEKCGYEQYGDIFKEEYCEHVMMKKEL